MNDGLTEAIEGLVKFTNDYMAKAQAELKVATDKIQAGTFTANDAFDSMMRATTLWVNAIAGTAIESMDFATTLTKYVGERTLTSDPFKVGQEGAWTLALTTPLTNAQKKTLEAHAVVTLKPAEVADGVNQTFVVEAKVREVGSGMYRGVVTATSKANPATTKPVNVKLQVG